jgi:hypothetical protein
MPKRQKTYALCIDNDGCPASLEVFKLYEVLPDAEAKSENLIRVIDESGEDYMYEASSFVRLNLPPNIERAIAHARESFSNA